ncbi:MAG: 6-phosphofructokinase [Acidimicrobiales bacterium]|nr:6-phosphofructokinase [Acidimicrobiales bacterium]
MRIGVLTGGGDCPGLNAVIRAVVRRGEGEHGHNLVGFRQGWKGAVDGAVVDLSASAVRGILASGGTVLGTARYHPDRHPGGVEAVLETVRRERLDALIAIGGDGSLGAARVVSEAGVPVVAVPKTIDNDVRLTDRSVGFDTAVSIATEAIDRVRTTAESHDRVMVVEVMGHHAGWIAVCAGIAGGADVVLFPEEPFDIAEVAAKLRHRHRRGPTWSVVVVAEGAVPAEGTLDFAVTEDELGFIASGAIGERVRDELRGRTGFDARVTVLGHMQRGGVPTAADRLLGSRFGVAAVDAVHAGRFGVMTALQGDAVRLVSLAEATGGLQLVPDELRMVAATLGE